MKLVMCRTDSELEDQLMTNLKQEIIETYRLCYRYLMVAYDQILKLFFATLSNTLGLLQNIFLRTLNRL